MRNTAGLNVKKYLNIAKIYIFKIIGISTDLSSMVGIRYNVIDLLNLV